MRLQESQWRESSLAIFTSGSHKEWEFEIFLLMKDPQNFIFILSKFCKKEDSWFRSPCHRLKALQPCRLQSLLLSWPVHCVACYVSKLQPAATPLVLSLSALGGGATSPPDSVGFQCCHRLAEILSLSATVTICLPERVQPDVLACSAVKMKMRRRNLKLF